jgi:hypothetical protein
VVMVSILTLVRICAGLHVNCLLFLSSFNQNCNVLTHFLVKICLVEFKLFNVFEHEKANSGFLQLLSELHLQTIDTYCHIDIAHISLSFWYC